MDGLLDLYWTHSFWVWAAIAGALLAAEVATGSGWLLWPAASAAAVGVLTTVIDLPAPVAALAFAAITIAATLVSRRYLAKRTLPEGGDINDPSGRLLGQRGRAVADFVDGDGRVFVDGKEWAAEVEGGGALVAGEPVEVTGVSGAQLKVRQAQ